MVDSTVKATETASQPRGNVDRPSETAGKHQRFSTVVKVLEDLVLRDFSFNESSLK